MNSGLSMRCPVHLSFEIGVVKPDDLDVGVGDQGNMFWYAREILQEIILKYGLRLLFGITPDLGPQQGQASARWTLSLNDQARYLLR